MPDTLSVILKLIVGLAIANVWLMRKNKPSPWRGGDAKNMAEEFAAYGLPRSLMLVIGVSKVMLATTLIAGIWIPNLTSFAAAGLAATLLAAVLAHLRVKDPIKKSLPAATLLAMSTALLVF